MSIPTAEEYLDWKKANQRRIVTGKTVQAVRAIAVAIAVAGLWIEEIPVMLFAIVLLLLAGQITPGRRR